MNKADKELEVFEWMKKQGYDRRASKDIAPIIVRYLEQHSGGQLNKADVIKSVCPTCHGTGKDYSEDEWGQVYKCNRCDGTGQTVL